MVVARVVTVGLCSCVRHRRCTRDQSSAAGGRPQGQRVGGLAAAAPGRAAPATSLLAGVLPSDPVCFLGGVFGQDFLALNLQLGDQEVHGQAAPWLGTLPAYGAFADAATVAAAPMRAPAGLPPVAARPVHVPQEANCILT